MAVVSAAFESSLSLSAYIQFSCSLDMQNAVTLKLLHDKVAPLVAHGLGTYRWLKEDVTNNPALIGRSPHSNFVEASVADAGQLLQDLQFNENVIYNVIAGEQVHRYNLTVETKNISCFFEVQEIGPKTDVSLAVLIHIIFLFLLTFRILQMSPDYYLIFLVKFT